jgi:hypothetical protein
VVAVITTVVVIMIMPVLTLVANVIHVLFMLYACTLNLPMLFVHAVLRNVDVVVPTL